jgi:Putative beta barrel porin-7 (BBP7)
MRTRILPALGALLVGTAQVFGQATPSSDPQTDPGIEQKAEKYTPALPSAQPGVPSNFVPSEMEAHDSAKIAMMPSSWSPFVFRPTQNSYVIWGGSEYLLWWVSAAPLPIPLVTTGPADAPNPGAIGQPGTQVLLGNSNMGFGSFSGVRFTLGGWLNSDGNIGIEATGFVLERRSNRFFTSSDNSGNPVLAFPFYNSTPGFPGEDALRIADPRPDVGQFAGNVLVASTLQLWGAEANGVLFAWGRPGQEIKLLAGLRYVDLLESLHIFNQTNDLATTPNDVTILRDQFGTRNQFYGAQIGARVAWRFSDCIFFDVTGKLAIGSNHETVDIGGQSFQSGPTAATPGAFPGGFYAQPSNIGTHSADQFAVLPSLQFKLSYQFAERWRAYVGYEILYWNQVVRPGREIDRDVNLTQSAVLFPGAAAAGPVSPAPLLNRTDFWAQGVSFGVEFRY